MCLFYILFPYHGILQYVGVSDRYAGDPSALWLQFQMAASSVTSLYKGI